MARFLADDLLKVTHHCGEGMRARRGAEDVVGRLDARDPLAVGLVDRVLQGAGPGLHRDDFGAEQPHPRDVECLALGVDFAHEHGALEAEQRGRSCCCDAMLASAGLGDDSLLAEALGEQRLPEHIVDLVRAGVVQILALEDDSSPTRVFGEPGNLGDDRRATRVGTVQFRQLGLERGIDLGDLVGGRELVDRLDQRFRHEPPAVGVEERTRTVHQARTHRPASRKLSRRATGSPSVTSASPISTTSAPAAR